MANAADRTVLITGATGVVGEAALGAFNAAGDRVIALSRRAPRSGPHRHLPLDLTDRAAVAAAAPLLADVTHLVYAALFEKPGLLAGWVEADQMHTNLEMFEALLGTLGQHAPNLQQVTLMQGTKAYGAHLHPIDIPARESSPRDPHDNFYWLQEDALRAAVAASSGRLRYTILRPQVVFGQALGSAMNLIPVVGVYGALLKSRGEPLHFPGRPFAAAGSPETLHEAVDADLLAAVLVWAAGSPAAANQTFNVTNGDLFAWRHVWPVIAEALGMAVGECVPLSLAQWLPAQAQDWERLVAAQGLQPVPMQSLLGESHFYADALFGSLSSTPAPSALVSTIKIRQAGFAQCIDTEAMFRRQFAQLQRRRVLPARDWSGP